MRPESVLKVVKLDLREYLIEPATRKREVRLSELKEYFSDPEAVDKILSSGRDPVVYRYYECAVEEAAGHMTLGLTTIYPGKVGKEYFMTGGISTRSPPQNSITGSEVEEFC